jgi:hypothetical protein
MEWSAFVMTAQRAKPVLAPRVAPIQILSMPNVDARHKAGHHVLGWSGVAKA